MQLPHLGVDVNARDYIYMGHERLKMVISSGGDTKVGEFHVVWEQLAGF